MGERNKMKVIIPSIKNTYSCQLCHKEFETENEEQIIEGSNPLCSYKCQFNIVYRALNKYSTEDLVMFLKLLNIRAEKHNAVFEISKVMTKRVYPVSPVSPNRLNGLRGHINKKEGINNNISF